MTTVTILALTSFIPTEYEFMNALTALLILIGAAVVFGGLAALLEHLGNRAEAAFWRKHP